MAARKSRARAWGVRAGRARAAQASRRAESIGDAWRRCSKSRVTVRLKHRLPMGSFPGEDRLFQLGDAGGAPRQHLAELGDQGGGRGVDQAPPMMEAYHAPRTLGDRDE